MGNLYRLKNKCRRILIYCSPLWTREKMKMILTTKETKFITMLLQAELRSKTERQLHAASHNSDFYDPDLMTVESILAQIEMGENQIIKVLCAAVEWVNTDTRNKAPEQLTNELYVSYIEHLITTIVKVTTEMGVQK